MRTARRWWIFVVAAAFVAPVRAEKPQAPEVFQHVKSVRYTTKDNAAKISKKALAEQIPGMLEVANTFEATMVTKGLTVIGYVVNDRKDEK